MFNKSLYSWSVDGKNFTGAHKEMQSALVEAIVSKGLKPGNAIKIRGTRYHKINNEWKKVNGTIDVVLDAEDFDNLFGVKG